MFMRVIWCLLLRATMPQSIPISYDRPDEILNIDSVLSAYLKNSKAQYSNLHILKEVVIKDTKIVKTTSHKDYGSLSSLSDQPDHLIPGERLKGCNSALECIKALATGMTFDNESFYVFSDYSRGKRIPAQIFVKGTPVDINYLANVDPNNIESVEIFLKDELGLINSAYNSNGAIVVNLKKAPETQKISLQDLKDLYHKEMK